MVGPIDLLALRAERERRRGHHLLAHLRTEAYAAYARPIYPAGLGSRGPTSTEANEAAIRRARRSGI